MILGGGGYWKYQSLKVLCHGISALPGRHGNERELVEQRLLTAQKHSSHIEIRKDNMHAKTHVISVLSIKISTTQNFQLPLQSTTSICTLLMEWKPWVQKAMLTSNGPKDWASFSGWRWFFTQSLYITNTALCQRLASRISDAHTPYFSVTPQLQVPHGATAFLHPSIYPPIPLSLWSSSFLSQNLRFRWAFSVRAPAVTHSSSKSNRKWKKKSKWGNTQTIVQQCNNSRVKPSLLSYSKQPMKRNCTSVKVQFH